MFTAIGIFTTNSITCFIIQTLLKLNHYETTADTHFNPFGIVFCFFYFSLGTEPTSISEDGSLPSATNSYLDSVIQKSYPNYVYLKEIRYVQQDRRAVIFPSDSITQDSHSEEIKDIE